MTRLDEMDKEEFRLVSRILRPDWTDEQYDEMWDDFQAKKADGMFEHPPH